MKFGTTMPVLGRFASGTEVADAQRILAQRAEALGFDSLWVPDHIVLPTKMKQPYPYTESGEWPIPLDTPFLEALSYLAFIAGVTTRIKLGTSVLVLPHRNPILTAKMLATIDVLSGGRTILGAGVGYLEEEITVLGAQFNKRGPLSDEYFKAMRELWSSPDPVFEGEFVTFRDIKCEPKPVQAPLPIWFGGHSRRMMRRVAEFGQGCIFASYTIDQFKAHHQLLVEEADRANRKLDSISRVVLLMGAHTIDDCLTQIEQFRELGIDYVIVNLVAWRATLPEYFSAMTEFAERAGMKPYATVEKSPFALHR